jgi:hypothetical protein
MENSSLEHIGNMREAIHALEVDKNAVIGDVFDNPVTPCTDLDIGHGVVPFTLTLFFNEFAA